MISARPGPPGASQVLLFPLVWIVIVAAALVFAAALQLGVLVRLGPRRPVGDEVEYLDRARARDPYGPAPFLRPPGLILLTRGLRTESRVRAAMALIGCLTVALVALAAWPAGGAATVLAILWLLLPERLLLACHVLPETLLAAVMAGVVLVLRRPDLDGALAVSLLGALALAGTLVRIDFLPVALLSGLALAQTGVVLEGRDWMALAGPTALALALWTGRNWRRYGRPSFEDTWAFNAIVAAERIAAPAPESRSLEVPVAVAFQRWRAARSSGRSRMALSAAARMLRRPVSATLAVIGRVWTYLGPDEFVSGRLLHPAAAYPELPPTTRARLLPFLRLGFPLLVTLCALGALVLDEPLPAYGWPAAGVAIAGVAVHTRTRYRVVVLPALALWAADLSVRSVPALTGQPLGTVGLIAAAAVGLVLLLERRRHGREPSEASLPAQARILELQDALEERLEWVRQLETESDAKSRTIVQLQDALEERLEWVRQVEAESNARSRTIVELQEALEERLEWVRRLEADGETKSETIAGLQIALEQAAGGRREADGE